jgi:hypothetical protein
MFDKKFLISVLVAVGCAIPASATLVTYASASSFAAATSGDTFSDIGVTQGNLGTSYTDLGVDFTDPLGLLGTENLSGWPAGQVITATTASSNDDNTITITFPSGVDAISFDANGLFAFSYVFLSVTDSSGTITPYLYEANSPAPLFFGVTTTDSTFSSFTIETEASVYQLALGNITIGSDPPETPEAATFLLVGTGLFLMGGWRRKRRGASGNQAASRGTVRTMSTGITPA